LQAREREDALSASFGDDACEPGEGSDVGELVEREKETGTFVVAVVGGVHQFFYQPDDEGGANRLMAARGDHMELMGPRQERVDIEWSLACGGASRLGANAREESRRRRPDARAFALFGREDTLKE
jgi:hypothetical protein